MTSMCAGLLLFTLFMAANAADRIIPLIKVPDVMSLAQKVKYMAKGA